MRVISIKQPWASLIAKGYKEYEFRSWRTNFRGEVFIHASKKVENKYMERFKGLDIGDYPTGMIIAKANLVDCIEVNKEFEDRLIEQDETVYGANKDRTGYAFKLENVAKLDKKIPVNGKLGIWRYEE